MDATYANRYELKYVLSYQTYFQICKEVEIFLKKDNLGDSEGKYGVVSIYYDTQNLRFFWEKIDGEKKRVKLRLRKYIPSSIDKKSEMCKDPIISVELKKRDNRTVSKKRSRMPESVARAFVEEPQLNKTLINNAKPTEESALCEIAHLKNLFRLEKKVVVSYIRQAFIARDGFPLRVTFDMNVRYRKNDFTLERKSTDKHVIMPNHIIMEIKYTSYLPSWIVYMLQKYNCEVRTFSKYCTAMEQVLVEQNGMVY